MFLDEPRMADPLERRLDETRDDRRVRIVLSIARYEVARYRDYKLLSPSCLSEEYTT